MNNKKLTQWERFELLEREVEGLHRKQRVADIEIAQLGQKLGELNHKIGQVCELMSGLIREMELLAKKV